MLPQEFTQGRQHIYKRWMPFMCIPWHNLKQQRWLGDSTASIPCLHQRHQHHCQRSLPINRLTAPALRRFKTHILFRLQYRFLNSPPVVIPLYYFGVRYSRIGAKEKIVSLFSGRVSNYDHANRNAAADVIPQTCYPQYQTLDLITLFADRYLLPALLSIGSYLSWAGQTLSLLRLPSTLCLGRPLGRQLVNGGVSANPTDQIHVLWQRSDHLTLGILAIGRDPQ